MTTLSEISTLYLEEHFHDNEKQIDNRLFIIYNSYECTYNVYGTRRSIHSPNDKYVNYNYTYHNSRIDELVDIICFTPFYISNADF